MNKIAQNTIAFMGVSGANADLACRKSEPYMQTLACATFNDVFEAVRIGDAAMGMIPMENSQAGRVAEIHQLLPQLDLHIVGEYFLPVQHVLATHQQVDIKEIKQAFSHPQALMQSRENLLKYDIEPVVFSNTAVAAQSVAKWQDSTKAALCSPLAAEIYGLHVIDDHMQDSDSNVTTFIKVAAEPLEEFDDNTVILSSILMTLRNIPAALYKALGGFATNHVNLLKLESYILGGASNTAQFLVTFEGHPDDKAVQLALDELAFFTNKIDILGVYPAAIERQAGSGSI